MPVQHPEPVSGYACKLCDDFVPRTQGPSFWRRAPDESWDTVLITPDSAGPIRWLGTREILGERCNVWSIVDPITGIDPSVYAQTVALTGVGKRVRWSPDFEPVVSRYGAPMGRASDRDGELVGNCQLVSVRLNVGGYDRGGAYWGHGAPLWAAWTDDATVFFRAADRQTAEMMLAARHPGAVIRAAKGRPA